MNNTTPCLYLCLDWLWSFIPESVRLYKFECVFLLFSHCFQNATIATPVFQVIANDPDNALTPSGTLSFQIQDDIEDASAFKIGNS